ncbi:MAG: hypothetical protein M1823_004108 [Watsoniomyces obsoletus]|nr:MAG: hypothetical protein M1823_004108 [Watsoniomyces obsoletus]
MLLTSGQISMTIASCVVFVFTTILFLSGYILQQQTVRSMQAVLKPPPKPIHSYYSISATPTSPTTATGAGVTGITGVTSYSLGTPAPTAMATLMPLGMDGGGTNTPSEWIEDISNGGLVENALENEKGASGTTEVMVEGPITKEETRRRSKKKMMMRGGQRPVVAAAEDRKDGGKTVDFGDDAGEGAARPQLGFRKELRRG